MIGVVLATCPRFGACRAGCCCAAWLLFCASRALFNRSSISCCCFICCCCAAICCCCAANASRNSFTSCSVIGAGALPLSDVILEELLVCALRSADNSTTAAHHLRTGFIIVLFSPVVSELVSAVATR